MKLSENYYTGREVQRKLGITEPALRNLVNQKKIKKITPPGRTYGVYPKSAIDRFAEKWEAFLMAKDPPKTIFRLAKREDMEAQEALDTRYVGPGVSIETLKTWIDANNETDYHVYYNDNLVAFAQIILLKREIIDQLFQNKIQWDDIHPYQDMNNFEPGKPIDLYVYSIASNQSLDEATRQHYMFVLLRGIGESLSDLGKRGIILENVYGLSSTPTGIAMALHIGMNEYKPSPRKGKTIKFIMEIDQSNSYLAKKYKEGLAEWKGKTLKNHNKAQVL